MDIKSLREQAKGRLVTARCAGCKAIAEELIPGQLPRMVCGSEWSVNPNIQKGGAA